MPSLRSAGVVGSGTGCGHTGSVVCNQGRRSRLLRAHHERTAQNPALFTHSHVTVVLPSAVISFLVRVPTNSPDLPSTYLSALSADLFRFPGLPSAVLSGLVLPDPHPLSSTFGACLAPERAIERHRPCVSSCIRKKCRRRLQGVSATARHGAPTPRASRPAGLGPAKLRDATREEAEEEADASLGLDL